MRTYQLQPGTLLQWEHAWRRGLEARRKFVVSLLLYLSHGTLAEAVATGRSFLLSSRTASRSPPYLAVPVSYPYLHCH